MDDSGRITSSIFSQAEQADRRGAGFGQWYVGPPPADSTPAATPAAAMTAVQDRLTQVADRGPLALANRQEEAEFEAQLNAAVATAGTAQVAGAPVLGPSWQRPSTTPPADPVDLARRMRAAEELLARGGRRSALAGAADQDAPSGTDVFALVEEYNALARSDVQPERPAPEPGSLPARVADLSQRAQADAISPEESFRLGLALDEVSEAINAEVREHAAGRDQFGTYGPRPDPGGEELLERARTDWRSIKAGGGAFASEPSEQDRFEAALNAQIAELGRNPELTRPALPEPAAEPAGKPAADPLANADPAVLLAALEKLGVDQQTLAGLVAGADEGARDGA
jgi:hypothetical protein